MMTQLPDALKPYENRILGHFEGDNAKTVVFFSGIHGNEPAGVMASKTVADQISNNKKTIHGNIYFIKGNCRALDEGIRYDFIDLNRIWKPDIIKAAHDKKLILEKEPKEMIELHDLLKVIINRHEGQFFFLDLHTTSAPSEPFITISDSINNRQFSKYYNLPVVLGIEEYLEGPLLTYLNEFGYISLGFEAGQHDDALSVEACEKFIWLSLQQLNLLKCNVTKFNNTQQATYFEIVERYALSPGDQFKMEGIFLNFQSIKKQMVLAIHNQRKVYAQHQGKIFMPLYQKQGDDGFFILQPIPTFWLGFSKWLREIKAFKLLSIVPGVKQDKEHEYVLQVNMSVARFFTKPILHLFGYRQRKTIGNTIYFIRRDRPISSFS